MFLILYVENPEIKARECNESIIATDFVFLLFLNDRYLIQEPLIDSVQTRLPMFSVRDANKSRRAKYWSVDV